MKPCSICGKLTDRTPVDRNRPVVCYDCKYSCRKCGAKIVATGGHSDLCIECLEKSKLIIQKSIKRVGPLGIIDRI